MADPARHFPDNPDTDFERSDWPIGIVGLVLLGIVLVLVAAPLVLIAVFPRAVSDVDRHLEVELPAPRLQIDAAAALATFTAAEQRKLDTYYWIDKQKGIVHVPIRQAMRKLAAQGIDGFPRGGS